MSDAVARPEIYRETMGAERFGIVQKPLTTFETLYNQGWLRKLFVLIVLAVLWEAYARWLDNELLVPTFTATVHALARGDRQWIAHRARAVVDQSSSDRIQRRRAAGGNSDFYRDQYPDWH